MKPTLDDATEDDVARFYGVQFPGRWVGKVIRKGKLVAAFGGVIEGLDGRWLAVFEVPRHLRAALLYRHAGQLLAKARDMGADKIIATCDQGIPRSAAFMERLGFVPTDEEHEGMVIWKWLH